MLLGAAARDPWGDLPAPIAPGSTPPGHETVTVSLDRTFVRHYADLAEDHNPIHLHDAAARAAGFDGAIAHGMSVLAVAAEAVIERHADGDARRVHGIGVRFSGPVRPDEPISIELRGSEDGDVAFSCRTPRGLSLKGGWARVGSAEPGDRTASAEPGGPDRG